MTDYTVGDTCYFMFTTRQFSTGAPFALAGSPVISAYENEGLTQITSGVSLGVDHDGVTGLNLVTVVASGANGFESGKDYHLVITTGTVDSVSVVGEVIGRFTLSRSAAAVDLANGTDGLGAIKTDTAAILVDTAEIGAAGAGLSAIPWNASWDAEVQSEVNDGLVAYNAASTTNITAGTITTTTNLTNLPAITAGWLTAAGIAAGALDGKGDWNIGKAGYSLSAAQTFDLTGNITGNLSGSVGSVTGFTPADITTIKNKTNSLTFTQAGIVDANIQYVNDVEVTGTGSVGDEWGP